MLDQLRALAVFAKTADLGSFRGAAKALALSPSVVSHHVSELERHLDDVSRRARLGRHDRGVAAKERVRACVCI